MNYIKVLSGFLMVLASVSSCSSDQQSSKPDFSFEGDDPGECSDKVDNDRDLLFDCDDEGCFGNPSCKDTSSLDSSSDPEIDQSTDSSSDTTLPTDAATDSDPQDSEKVCAETDLLVQHEPIALMLLVDMSGSMAPYYDDEKNSWDNYDNPGRWGIIKPAIENLLEKYGDGAIYFGYDWFPALYTCSVNTHPGFDASPNNTEQILATLPADDAPHHQAYTPMRLAIENYLEATFAPNFSGSDFDKYLLLISDGQDTCGTGDREPSTPEELASLSGELLSLGIKTFTIGFGEGGSAVMTDQLDAISAAGGTAYTDHLSATSQAELEEVFAVLTDTIITCTFSLPKQDGLVDTEKLNFYSNDSIVPMDPDCAEGTGWTWADDSHESVTLCESVCQIYKTGESDIKATWGCPTAIIVK